MNYSGSFTRSFAITPHDTNPLTATPVAVFVGGAGNITCRLPDDTADVVLNGLTAGSVIYIAPTHIRATGTTATNLKGLT